MSTATQNGKQEATKEIEMVERKCEKIPEEDVGSFEKDINENNSDETFSDIISRWSDEWATNCEDFSSGRFD